MANEFIGSTILATVASPPNAQLKGVVQDIQDRVLFLRDVFWLESRTFMPHYEISGGDLVDLEVIPAENDDHRPSPTISVPSLNPTIEMSEPPLLATFVDPAILSVGKPPSRTAKRSDTIASATLTEPFSNLAISTRPVTSELATTEIMSVKTTKQFLSQGNQVSSPVQAAFQELMAKTLNHTTGNAPLLRVQKEGSTQGQLLSTDEHLPLSSIAAEKRKAMKTRGRKQRGPADSDLLKVEESVPRKVKKSTPRKHTSRFSEAQNGWATEEATDIQELGEFDFAANLSKFDKREVFRQLKEDDTIAEGDRLVAHNRLPKPGTAGGKNLHWTENVLDSPQDAQGLWNSEAGETADDLERILDSGRSSTRQKSHSRTRILASRKGSHAVEEPMRRQSQISARQPSFDAVPSPRLGSRRSFTSPYIGSNGATHKNALRLVGSNRVCPSISPIQMLELEQYAVADLGLSEDILSENAARGIAEVALQLHVQNDQTLREVKLVIVVGNHKTGARTLAAARHLRNRGFRTTAVVMGREEDTLDLVRQQANAYTKAADLLLEFQTGLRPSLLIDALTGMHVSLEDLRREDQQWCFEVAIWADRLKTQVLSVDVPSGIDPSSGAIGEVDGHALAFHPDVIIALGAPKPYLLSFLEQAEPAPKVFVADISLGKNAWKRLGGRRRTGVDFGNKWLVEIHSQTANEV